MLQSRYGRLVLALIVLGGTLGPPRLAQGEDRRIVTPAKSAIFFVGDGMSISTITATRAFSVGLDGELFIDQMPFTAISKTYTSDHITPDSAGTMTAMITGTNTNSGILGMGPTTEPNDFNGDGDGPTLTTLLELAKASGRSVGVVSTTRATHATPAACYAHVNNRGKENEIALQALPTDPTYNTALGSGIDVLFAGGRRHFVPTGILDEEGVAGRRSDGRDLRGEFMKAGYSYVWNEAGFGSLTTADLPVLGLFNSSHMSFEYDRALDIGGEPSLSRMTRVAIELLSSNPNGFFLMVEGGRIDHAHHASNAYRALVDTEEFDRALGVAIERVDLQETLIVATADHSHVFNIAGYPLRTMAELPYAIGTYPSGWVDHQVGNGILNTVYRLSTSSGNVYQASDTSGVPYTALVYGNGPGYRAGGRVNPFADTTPGYGGVIPTGPTDPAYRQEAAVPLSSETHGGEDVAIHAIGRGSYLLRGTVKNTACFDVMRDALGL